MNPRFRSICWPIVMSCLVAACDQSGLEPGEVSFSRQVQPILTDRCAFGGCHASTSPAAGQSLAEGLAYMNIVNVPSQELPSMDRVKPGDPDRSYLVHKIQGTHLEVGGSGLRMPWGQEPLSDDQINRIRAWIQQGARNN
ncbi:MAG: hypothetical protein HYY94_03380 [Gemmatimonadetes bacterium]|nr:hypothetical protein [Gemmatimonadota bacterium]